MSSGKNVGALMLISAISIFSYTIITIDIFRARGAEWFPDFILIPVIVILGVIGLIKMGWHKRIERTSTEKTAPF